MNIKLNFGTLDVIVAANHNILNLKPYVQINGETEDGHTHAYYISDNGCVYDYDPEKKSYSTIGEPTDDETAEYVLTAVLDRLHMDIEQVSTILVGMANIRAAAEYESFI